MNVTNFVGDGNLIQIAVPIGAHSETCSRVATE